MAFMEQKHDNTSRYVNNYIKRALKSERYLTDTDIKFANFMTQVDNIVKMQLDLLEITEGRYDGGATVIASQCPIPDWYAAIGDPTIADAICDRLLHTAYRLELRGDSMRKKQGEIRKEGG